MQNGFREIGIHSSVLQAKETAACIDFLSNPDRLMEVNYLWDLGSDTNVSELGRSPSSSRLHFHGLSSTSNRPRSGQEPTEGGKCRVIGSDQTTRVRAPAAEARMLTSETCRYLNRRTRRKGSSPALRPLNSRRKIRNYQAKQPPNSLPAPKEFRRNWRR
ncbi:hypothetical protein GJAV_G00209450 [Gymnothorax javanicus]|nr:hypothetical protein GJAV_G00209450 [Gymnothorax javanicus]